MSEVGAALKLLRNRLGWPQKKLASAAGVTPSMISGYERGEKLPNLPTLLKLLEALGADLCDLYCATEVVNGRQPVGHDLNPRFRLGQATSAGSPAPKPADASTHRLLPRGSGAAAEGDAAIPDAVAEALTEWLATMGTLMRYVLVVAARPR